MAIVFPGEQGAPLKPDLENIESFDNSQVGGVEKFGAISSGVVSLEDVVAKSGDTMEGTLNTLTLLPVNDSTSDLGSSTPKYYRNAYIDKVFYNSTGSLDGATAGEVRLTGDLVPNSDDTEWLGEIGSPFKAFKGIILKDTTNGKHYKITVISGTLTATALD